MTTKPPKQTPFNGEISLFDIIKFFKGNLIWILLFIILGGTLGFLYGKIANPAYVGSILVRPAKVAGLMVIDPKTTLTKLNMNSYYSKETFLACNPKFYKDRNMDEEIDYDMSGIIKPSITKDGNLIEIKIPFN